MSQLKLTWQNGDEKPLPDNINVLRNLAREVQAFEHSILGQAGDLAHYLNLIREWAVRPGEVFTDAARAGEKVEADFRMYAADAYGKLATVAADFRKMAAIAQGVQVAVDEHLAHLGQTQAKAAKLL